VGGRAMDKFVNKIICGDALKILKQIPDKSIDMILSDPPFFIRRQIIIHRSMNPKKYKYVGKDIVLGGWDWDAQWDSEKEYLEWCKGWFGECVRVLREGGHFLCFFDRLKQWWLYEWGNSLGMITRQPLYWLISNPVPRARCVDFMGGVSSIFWATKNTYSRKVAIFNYKLGQHRNYATSSLCQGKERLKDKNGTIHPTQKPLVVIEWLLSYLSQPNELVLDPFVGVGSTAVACKRLNRRFIGIDSNHKYVSVARKRLTMPDCR